MSEYKGTYPLDAYTLRRMPWAERQAAKKVRSAYLAAAKEAKKAVTRTCQICNRPIFAESGVIAHHGYTRPGGGYQTASCYGARAPAWERSRDRLGQYIAYCLQMARTENTNATAVRTGTKTPTFAYNQYIKASGRQYSGSYKTCVVKVTAESWPWIQACFLAGTYGAIHYNVQDKARTFEQITEECAKYHESLAARWESDRVEMLSRFDAWVQVEGVEQ